MKNAIIRIGLFFFLFFVNRSFGQHKKIDVVIHSRVDTTQTAIKEIAQLWIQYLNATPDSSYNNPYWNWVEKNKFKHFDFSIPYLYQFPSNQILDYYKPTILSIEKEGNNYGIRTIFVADGLEGEYRSSNPWCITKLYAIKENGDWKLKNALPIITENWNKKTVGKISFIYPSHHNFNEHLAKKANEFCSEMSEKFQLPNWEPFDFYITDSGDELGQLLNFDFFFAGYTKGVGMNENRMLLSGMGSEFYPHEFIHLIVPNINRHHLIEEGFATWNGGQGGKTFEESATILAHELRLNTTVTFTDVLNKKWGWQFSAFYTSGAILCKAAYDKGGVNLVKKFLETPPDNLIPAICTLLEIEEKQIDTFWRTEVSKHKTN